MKILVTGAYGFIGSFLIKKLLLETDYEVVGFGRDTSQKNKLRIKDVKSSKFSLIKGDLCGDISELCEGVDVVIHTAAKTFVDHSIRTAMPFIQSNLIGTYNLLESARQNKVKRYIQVSTDEVYGSILEGAHTEESPLHPSNPYSAAKAAADCLVQSYVKTYNLNAVITRTENNCGPFQHPQKAIPVFVKKALEDKNIPLYGDGKHKRMWMHVSDHCEALMLLIDKGDAGEIYNISGSQELENVELSKIILNRLGKSETLIEYIPDDIIRPGHDRRYAIDSTKLRNLGWSPKMDLEKTIAYTVDWFRDNKWWY
jgi:dTDP-glucose 4,6-dehydratase